MGLAGMSDAFSTKGKIIERSVVQKTGFAEDARKLDINNLPDLLTVREVSDLLRVAPLTIKRWGKRGRLPAIRINSRGDRRFKREDVLKLLNHQL